MSTKNFENIPEQIDEVGSQIRKLYRDITEANEESISPQIEELEKKLKLLEKESEKLCSMKVKILYKSLRLKVGDFVELKEDPVNNSIVFGFHEICIFDLDETLEKLIVIRDETAKHPELDIDVTFNEDHEIYYQIT